jgi:hypothetical protein
MNQAGLWIVGTNERLADSFGQIRPKLARLRIRATKLRIRASALPEMVAANALRAH